MKHKAFLIVLVLIFTFGSIALADYIEPVGTAPSSNTPEVLKTQSSTSRMYEKIGIGNGSLQPDLSLLANGPYIGVTQSGTNYGTFSEKFVSNGASIFANDLRIWVGDDNTTLPSNFDQYKSPLQNKKPLQTIVAGQLISPIAITSNNDILTNSNLNNYSLDLKQSGAGSNAFNPTTNIGLGNSCNLYPPDIGSALDDGGGCPSGMYMTMFKDIDTGKYTPTSSNNMNGVPIAVCTEFNPSVNPQNIGACSNAKTFTDLVSITKNPQNSTTGTCTFTASNGSSGAFNGNSSTSLANGKNVKIRWYALGGNPPVSYINTLDDKKSFTYGCGQDSWKVVVTDDYYQYAEATR